MPSSLDSNTQRPTRKSDPETIAAAVAAAADADAIVVAVGEDAILSGEGHCMADLGLVGGQSQLVRQLKATGKPLVMIVMAGRPLAIGREAAMADAVIYSFHPGTMGGPALADLLMGRESPSGKTPVTFPSTSGQCPIYYNHANTAALPPGPSWASPTYPTMPATPSSGARRITSMPGTSPSIPSATA